MIWSASFSLCCYWMALKDTPWLCGLFMDLFGFSCMYLHCHWGIMSWSNRIGQRITGWMDGARLCCSLYMYVMVHTSLICSYCRHPFYPVYSALSFSLICDLLYSHGFLAGNSRFAFALALTYQTYPLSQELSSVRCRHLHAAKAPIPVLGRHDSSHLQ